MNRYQEALNKVKEKFVISLQCLTSEDKNKQMKYVNILQELVDTTKPPTLEEVKKEWEALGYTWEENEIYICISIEDSIDESLKDIYIDKKHKSYECFDEDDADSISLQLTLKEHQLLTKTFRALGWEV